MSTITTRSGKGSPLTNSEVDANFTNLNTDKLESGDLSVVTATASGSGSLSYLTNVFTFTPPDLSSYIVNLSSFDTDDLAEGSTNLYYTNERVDDRVNTLIQAGLGITTSYDDANGELTIESDTIEENCKNATGSTILKGTPVYQTGTSGNFMEIAPADASNASKMPAVGVLSEDLTAGSEGSILLMGRISGINTSAFSEGDVIYVASGGGYTNIRPTGESVYVQNLGRVTKVGSSNGGGVVMGSGRVNDIPNLGNGKIFIGNGVDAYEQRTPVVADISDLTATAAELNYTDGVTSNIQTQLDNKQPLDADLTAISAIANTDGNFIVGNGTTWVAESGGTARASLGLTIGTDVQAYSAILAATTASFTTADETKLNGIEAGATADQTASEILSALLTVDGTGTGLDADLLDGNDSTAFATAAQGALADSALQSSDIGSSILAYDSNLQSFVTTFTVPTTDGTIGQALVTDGAGTISFGDVDSLPSQAGNAGYYLTTDGTTASWADVNRSLDGGSASSVYLTSQNFDGGSASG
jgi:hypothetical protein